VAALDAFQVARAGYAAASDAFQFARAGYAAASDAFQVARAGYAAASVQRNRLSVARPANCHFRRNPAAVAANPRQMVRGALPHQTVHFRG
jgi:hypothetical protein